MGTVVNITPTEVFVDVDGRKQTGVIALDDLSAEPISNPSQAVSIGDKLSLVIMKTDDSEGVLKLSKKLVDAFQGWEEIVKAKENDEILEGVVSAVVKGGVVAVTNGSRVFILLLKQVFREIRSLMSLRVQQFVSELLILTLQDVAQ